MDQQEPSLIEKLHSETATIAWHDLQRFFAQGLVVVIDSSLDLVKTAALFAEDNAEELEVLMSSGKVDAPNNDLAKRWYDSNAELWTVVVAPYVLVQESLNK